jgi:hypothetical protein
MVGVDTAGVGGVVGRLRIAAALARLEIPFHFFSFARGRR